MNLPAQITSQAEGVALPALVERAAGMLASAKGAAEVLEARDVAGMVYDAAKRAARLAKAKDAHDEIITKLYRAQADAMEIEAGAKRRLADEYDAAQERGDVSRRGQRNDFLPEGEKVPTASEVGLSHKDISDARAYRDAEAAEPGIVRRVTDEAIEAGQEPTKARVKRAVYEATGRSVAPPPRGKEAHCQRVKEAVAALCGLPPAAEVAGYFSEYLHLEVMIDEQLPAASRWLAEFVAAWGETHDV